MQKASDLAKQAIKGSITNRPNGSHSLSEDGARFINQVFEELIVNCPAWKVAIDGDPDQWAGRYKAELVEAIKEEGVTNGEQISSGISAYRRLKKAFLPSPGEFAALCSGKSDAHNSAAYRKTWESNLLQLCHKRSEEDNKKGLEKIMEIKKAINETL